MNDNDDYIEALKMAMSSPTKFNDLSVSARNAIFSTNTGIGAVGAGVDSWSAYNVTASSQPTVTTNIIKGEMLTSYHDFDEHELLLLSDMEIKRKMIALLVDEMITSKLVEFTKNFNPSTGLTAVRARVFVTPDNNVQLLRKLGY